MTFSAYAHNPTSEQEIPSLGKVYRCVLRCIKSSNSRSETMIISSVSLSKENHMSEQVACRQSPSQNDVAVARHFSLFSHTVFHLLIKLTQF